MVGIAAPVIEQEEIDAVNRVMQSGILAQGPMVAQLEADMAAYCGTKYAVAVNSGTAALHVSLHAAGVGPGDEVITVPYTFIATLNSILMTGAKPVLVDIDPATFNIDVAQVEAAITPRTKAIIPVHLYGQPADMTPLRALAKAHNLVIIEDACQAIGAEYDGVKAGALGDLGCFSFYATKNIMCGEGGIVTTNNADYVARMKQFRQHGMSAQYDYVGIGYNYRLSDLHAAIAVEQVKKLGRFTDARRRNAAAFDAGLQGIAGLVTPVVLPGRTHVYHQYTIKLESGFASTRQALIDALKAKDFGSGIYYPKGLHEFSHIAKFGYHTGDFPVTETLVGQVLSLPIHPRVTPQNIQSIIDVIKEAARA